MLKSGLRDRGRGVRIGRSKQIVVVVIIIYKVEMMIEYNKMMSIMKLLQMMIH